MGVTLDDYCKTLAETVIANEVGNIRLSEQEIAKFVESLKKEFTQLYADSGYPYGEDESDMVRYLLENTKYETEE